MQELFQPSDTRRFEDAIQRFDRVNAEDPNHESVDGKNRPRECVYAERLSEWVLRLRPNASEALRLAARCQHIQRWKIPRQSHPMTRDGYLQWKEALKRMHAQISGGILSDAGYPATMIERVQSLNLKRDLKRDEECQTLEDALCLVFLQHQFAALAGKASEEKVITALKKSWAKMSAQGRDAALGLEFGEREKQLLASALQ